MINIVISANDSIPSYIGYPTPVHQNQKTERHLKWLSNDVQMSACMCVCLISRINQSSNPNF